MMDLYEAFKNLNNVEYDKDDNQPYIDESLIHGMEQANSNGIFEDFVLDSLQYEYHTIDELCEAFEYTNSIDSTIFNEAIATFLCHKNKNLNESLDETKLLSLAEFYNKVKSSLGDVKTKELEQAIAAISKAFFGLFGGSTKAAGSDKGVIKAIFGGKSKNMVIYYSKEKDLGSKIISRLALIRVKDDPNVRVNAKFGIAAIILEGVGTVLLFKDLKTFKVLNADALRDIFENKEEAPKKDETPVEDEKNNTDASNNNNGGDEEVEDTSNNTNDDVVVSQTQPQQSNQKVEITKKLLQKFHRLAYNLGLKIFDSTGKPFNIAKFQDAQRITLKNINQFTIENKGKKYPLDKWLLSMVQNKLITESFNNKGLNEEFSDTMTIADMLSTFEGNGVDIDKEIELYKKYAKILDIDDYTSMYMIVDDGEYDPQWVFPEDCLDIPTGEQDRQLILFENAGILAEYLNGNIYIYAKTPEAIVNYKAIAKKFLTDYDFNESYCEDIDELAWKSSGDYRENPDDYKMDDLFVQADEYKDEEDLDESINLKEDIKINQRYSLGDGKEFRVIDIYNTPGTPRENKELELAELLPEVDEDGNEYGEIISLSFSDFQNKLKSGEYNYLGEDLKNDDENPLNESLSKEDNSAINIGEVEKEIKTPLDFQVVDFIDHEIKTYADITKSESEYFLEKDELIDCIIGDLEAASYSFNEKYVKEYIGKKLKEELK